MTQLAISLLGPFQVTLDGQALTDFSTDKARALLAYLAVQADQPHWRDTLVGLLWPEQPQAKARQSLRQTLLYLRQALDDPNQATPFLRVTRQTIQFDRQSDHWLDVTAFVTRVEACRAHRHRRIETCRSCLNRLEQAVEQYRGDFMTGFSLADSAPFEEWALLKREWLHRLAVEALGHLSESYERRGVYERARHYAWRQMELDPWNEEAHRQLMRLLALDGQRSAALAQYETCRRALADELGVEPTIATTTLYQQIRESANLQIYEFANLHNLPPPTTPFVGRQEDLEELADLLANPDCRLLTLVGPGGIGKTRLALRAAEEQIGAYPDGIHFVPLAPVGSSELLLSAIADALDFSFQDQRDLKQQFLDYLREKELLLVLDNLEHLLDGVDLLAEVLQRAPGVVLLVTSRERLNLREEWVHQVGGLACPEGETTEGLAAALTTGKGLEGWGATKLFLQSARRARRDFSFSEQQAPSIVRICQLLDGIPLGVELAAAWVAARSCHEIAQEIERNLDVLTTRLRDVPERHRSIRATFEHSWQLLTQEEKNLFAQLSVFRGGFRRDAATRVAGASPATLLALLDKSLIHRVSSDRFEMHGLLRQYAVEKLRANPQELEKVRTRHSRHFAAFLERQEKRLRGASQKQALLEIAPEIENVRRAWRLAVSRRDVQSVQRSLKSLYYYLNMRCRFREGIDLLALVVKEWHRDGAEAAVVGKALTRQGALYRRLGHYQQAKAVLVQGLEILERLEMQTEHTFCLVTLADVSRSQGNFKEATRLAQQSLALSRQTEDVWGIARSLSLLGMVRYRTGDVDRAEVLLQESLAMGRESGDHRLIMSPLNSLGDVACHRGDYPQARAIFEECLTLSRELDDQFNAAMHLNNLGTVLHVMEKCQEAQPYYQKSLEICREIGDRKGQAIALSNLGEVAHDLGDHSGAFAFYQQALAIGRDIRDQRTVTVCLNNLGQIACAQGSQEVAKDHLGEALKIATDIQTVSAQLQVLVNLAILYGGQGQSDRAAALLGLVRGHPASDQEIQEKAERLLDELGLVPPDGEPRSIDSIVAEILAEITPGKSRPPK